MSSSNGSMYYNSSSSRAKTAVVGHDGPVTLVRTSPLPISKTTHIAGMAMFLGTAALYYAIQYIGGNNKEGPLGCDIAHETTRTSCSLIDQIARIGTLFELAELLDLRSIPHPFPNFPPLASAINPPPKQERLDVDLRGYYGAEIRTIENFKYGRFVVSMKPAPASGVVSSFFTFHTHVNLEANWNEIDIEFLGGKYRQIQFNVFTPRDKNTKPVDRAKLYPLNFTPSDSFHEYRFDWGPKSVTWYVDGKEYHKIEVELNKPQKIMLNLWNSASPEWAGPMNTSCWQERAATYKASYQWIKVFRYNETTMRIEDNVSFFEDFKDEMSLKQKWTKARHTFTGNMCRFYPENARRVTSGKTSLLELNLSRNDLELEQLTKHLHRVIADVKDVSVATQLLKRGADPNWKDTNTGNTATHLAAWKNNVDLINTLLQYGANPFILNNKGETAYNVAKTVGHENIANMLNKARNAHVQHPLRDSEL